MVVILQYQLVGWCYPHLAAHGCSSPSSKHSAATAQPSTIVPSQQGFLVEIKIAPIFHHI